MNYQHHYDKLIETRRKRVPVKGHYYERHHVVMKSMGGCDDPKNIVTLTAREHFLAHWLLWRIHRNREAALAFFQMCRSSDHHQRNLSARKYEIARMAFSETQQGNLNPMCKPGAFTAAHKAVLTFKGRTHTDEVRERIKQYHLNYMFSDESKKKMSDSAKKRFQKCESIKLMMNGKRKKSLLKLETAKREWKNPQIREAFLYNYRKSEKYEGLDYDNLPSAKKNAFCKFIRLKRNA